MQSWGRVKLTEVNPHLVCVLCHGYFIDATTMAECPHSFCRSCIVLYLETKSYCPICEVQIHKTKPHLNLKPDKTLQDIVYKLVPGLYHEEMRRRKEFYAKYPNRDLYLSPEARGVGVERIIYSPEDLISLSLEYYDERNEVDADGRLRKNDTISNRSDREREEWAPTRPGTQPVVPLQKAATAPDCEGLKRYLQCPAVVTMSHLKKFLRLKYGLSTACTVEILYRRESLPDSYSLMDIAYIYTWKRNGPMRFYYRIHVPTTLRTILPPLKPSSEPIRDLGPPKKLPGSELLDAVGLRPKPPEPQVEPQEDLLKIESSQKKEVEEKEESLTNVSNTKTKEEDKERSSISPEESDAVNQLLALSSALVAPAKPPEVPEIPPPVVTSEPTVLATTTVTTTAAAPTTTTTAAVEPAKPATSNGNVFKVPQSMTKRFVFNGGKLVAVKNKQSHGKGSGKPSDKTKVNGKLLNGDNSVDRFTNPLGLGGVQGGKLPPGSPRPPPNSEKIMKTKYMPPSGLLMSRLPEVTVSQNNITVEQPVTQKTQVPQVSSSQPQPKQNQNQNRAKVNASGNKLAMSNGQPPHRKECNRLEQIVQNCLKKETTQKKEAEARCEANGVKRSGTLSVNGNGEPSEAARAASSIRPPDHAAGDRVDSAASESSILKRKLNDNPFNKRSPPEGPGDPKKRRLVTPDVSIELTTHPSKDKQQKERKREPSDLPTLTKRFLHDIQRASMKKIDSELKINNLDQMCASTVKIEKVPAPPSQNVNPCKASLGDKEKSKPIDSTEFSSEDDQLFIDIRNKCEALKRKNQEPASIAIERVSEDPTAKTSPSLSSPSAENEPMTPTTSSSSTPPITTTISETSPKPSGTHKKLPRLIEINAPPRPKLPSLIPDSKQKTGLKMTTVRKEVPIGKEVPLVRRDSNGALDLSSGMSPPTKNGSKSPFPRPSSASDKSITSSALSPLMAMTSFPMPETKPSPIRIPTLKPKTSPNPRPSSLSSSSPSPPAEPRAASEVFTSAAYQQLYRRQMELQSRLLASQVNNNWSRDPLSAKKVEEWMRNAMNLPHHPLMYPSQLSPESGRK